MQSRLRQQFTSLDMKQIISLLFATVVALLLVAVIGLVMAIPLMLLWNWLMPDIFQLPQISIFQAFGLAILSGILFRSNGSSSNG